MTQQAPSFQVNGSSNSLSDPLGHMTWRAPREYQPRISTIRLSLSLAPNELVYAYLFFRVAPGLEGGNEGLVVEPQELERLRDACH